MFFLQCSYTVSWACKKLGDVLLVVTILLELCTSPVVTTTYIILSSNKIQNGNIFVQLTQVQLENTL